jgi:TolB-like protein/Tfp pilus assembly protein PilF
MIEQTAAAHGGRVFNTAGDGFMLEFSSGHAAVEAALALAETCVPRVRVGVHLGDVVVQPDGDILGHGVNVAARLMARSAPGSVLVSAAVRQTIRGALAERFVSRGVVQLDKMAETIEVFGLAADGAAVNGRHARLRFDARALLSHWRWAAAGAVVLVATAVVWLSLRPAPVTSPAPDAMASVAVLPFENLSSDKENAYFVAGVQDEILTKLSKIASLKVISRTSTASMASRPDNLPDIAKKLGVAHILEGSVQRAGVAVHINVQLIRADTDSHLWAQSFDRKLDDIFAVQAEIATEVAAALDAKLTAVEKRELTVHTTANLEAYDAYLHALTLYRQGMFREYKDADVYVQRAVALDPTYAQAWALSAVMGSYLYSAGDASQGRRNATRAALDAARRYGPDLPETGVAEAYVTYRVEGDLDAARGLLEQLQSKWQNNTEILFALATIAKRQGRWSESLGYIRQVIARDPLSPTRRNELAIVHWLARDYPKALHAIDEGLAIAPANDLLVAYKVRILQSMGRLAEAGALLTPLEPKLYDETLEVFVWQAALTRNYDHAIKLLASQVETARTDETAVGDYEWLLTLLANLLEQAKRATAAREHYVIARDLAVAQLKTQPDNTDALLDLASASVGLGDRDTAITSIDRAIRLRPAKDVVERTSLELTRATLLARLGDRELAIPALARLLKQPCGLTPALLRLDPNFDKLRGDPRFEALARDPS